jgi:SAM-dependent methyltransferase
MRPLVERLGVSTALDVGANAGYFSLKLAELGAMVIAIEPDPGAFRTASLAVSRSQQRSRVGTMRMEVRPDTIELLPSVDAVVVLSLWHHLVHEHGLAVASDLLRGLWERTAEVLFFDTGEREMPASYGLPDFEPTAREWLSAYLAGTCEGSRVEHLGVHGAFDADGRPAQRNLFAVVRSSHVAGRFRV